MNGTITIFRKEWHCFTGSDRGMFVLYALLILTWSSMLAAPQNADFPAGPLWLIFFSVVISANFSNTVFIAERIHGNLEILLTSGLSRQNILYGKMLFVGGMSCGIGLLCIGLSMILRHLLFDSTLIPVSTGDIILYGSAVFMNTANSAYLSIRMPNPRLLHFANLLLLGSLVTLYSLLTFYIPVSSIVLSAILTGIGCAGTIAARRLYNSEKILQPVHW